MMTEDMAGSAMGAYIIWGSRDRVPGKWLRTETRRTSGSYWGLGMSISGRARSTGKANQYLPDSHWMWACHGFLCIYNIISIKLIPKNYTKDNKSFLAIDQIPEANRVISFCLWRWENNGHTSDTSSSFKADLLGVVGPTGLSALSLHTCSIIVHLSQSQSFPFYGHGQLTWISQLPRCQTFFLYSVVPTYLESPQIVSWFCLTTPQKDNLQHYVMYILLWF